MKKNLGKEFDFEFYLYCRYPAYEEYKKLIGIISFLLLADEIEAKEHNFLSKAISAVWCERY